MRRSNFLALLATSSSTAFFAEQVNPQSKPITSYYDITEFGADPTGAKDSSKALIQMLKAFRQKEKPIIFPSGKFVFKDPKATIEILHTGRKPGIYIQGAGVDRTTLVFNAPNKSAIKLINEGDSQFTWGNYIGHLTIDGSNAANGRGIESVGQWLSKLEFLRITKFGSDAIWFPDRSDLNRRWFGNSKKIEETSSDRWSNAFFTMENCFISNNSGWGIKNDAGSAWSNVDIKNTGIYSNQMGGIYKPGPNFNFILGAIAYNNGPGVLIARSLEYTSYGLLFDRVEFDGNKKPHVVIRSAKDTVFNGCRFIHDEDSAYEFRMYPGKSVEINANSTNYKYDIVQNVKFINPKIRWNPQHKQKLVIFDFMNSYNINLIDIERLELNTSVTSDSPITLIANIHAGLTHRRMAVSQTMSEHHVFYAEPTHPLSLQL
jgi:hypothetical protein